MESSNVFSASWNETKRNETRGSNTSGVAVLFGLFLGLLWNNWKTEISNKCSLIVERINTKIVWRLTYTNPLSFFNRQKSIQRE